MFSFKHILSALLMLCCISESLATHIVGGGITYECISLPNNPNARRYRFTMKVYRDCLNGQAQFDSPAYINFYRGTYQNSITLQSAFVVPISIQTVGVNQPDCIDDLPNLCLQEATYVWERVLTVSTQSYFIAYQRCCRTNAITNILDPGSTGATYFVEITPQAQQVCNSSPVFNNFPPVVVCNNYPLEVDYSVKDKDGDQLVYSFCGTFKGGGNTGFGCDATQPLESCPPPFDPVDFAAPTYTPAQPMGGNPVVKIDPQTGYISGTPNKNGQFVVGVCVEEYRNGVLLSVSRRDFQFNVAPCAPQVAARVAFDSLAGPQQYVIKNCSGSKSVTFVNNSFPTANIDNFQWKFDLKNNNTFVDSTHFNLDIEFPDYGSYNGTLVLNKGQDCSDTAYVRVDVYPPGSLDLGPDVSKCPSEVAVLTATLSDISDFRWQDKSSLPVFNTIVPGTYWVEGKNRCGTKLRDSVQVSSLPDCPCPEGTFYQTLGFAASREVGSALCPASDGGIYLAGEKDDRTSLAKISPEGKVLWARQFAIQPGALISVTQIIEDSEGMIVGLGTQGAAPAATTGAVFRYDPTSHQFLWSKVLEAFDPETSSLIESAPGGNYLINQNPKLVGDRITEIHEVNRTTGNFMTGRSRAFSHKSGMFVNTMLLHQGALYLHGWAHTQDEDLPPFNAALRSMLMRVDASTLAVDWTMASHVDTTSQTANFEGLDAVIDNDTLVSAYFGNEAGSSSTSYIYLQKTTLGGDIVWVKRYRLPDALIEELVAVSDGYLILAHNFVDTRYLLKTDKNGNLLFVKQLDVNTASFPLLLGLLSSHQNQLLNSGDHVYMASFDNYDIGDVLLMKMDKSGSVSDSCGFVNPINVPFDVVLNPVRINITPTLQVSQTLTFPLSTTPTPFVLAENVLCSCGDPLVCDYTVDLGPDLVLCRDTTLLLDAGPGFASYLWQDGSTGRTFSATGFDIFSVAATDSCGTVFRDTILIVPSLVGDIKLADAEVCTGKSVTLSIPGFDTYTWSPASGLSCTNCPTVTIRPTATTQYNLLATNADGCEKRDTFQVTVLPVPMRTYVISFFPNQSVVLGGQTYTQPATVMLPVPSTTGGCDSLNTYILRLIPTALDIQCPANLNMTLPVGAATMPVTYALPAAITNCPGGTTLQLLSGLSSGSNFPAGATEVCYTASNTCGDRDTCCFTVRLTATPTTLDMLCLPGKSITLPPGATTTAVNYPLPGMITNCPVDPTLQLLSGLPSGSNFPIGITQVCYEASACGIRDTCCFTVRLTATPATLDIQCPANQSLTLPVAATTMVVNYALPTTTTNCPTPPTLKLLKGLASGSNFPIGTTQVCYEASTTCGSRDTCCFNVTISEPSNPCDIKTIGCLRFELLDIRLDSIGQRRYRIRAINSCASPLNYFAIQLPNGVLAAYPKEAATYTAPNTGNKYAVRNPNYSPFYSVRYKAIMGDLNNGESDVFEYALPQQSAPAYIHIGARLNDGTFHSAHINTFYCPVQPYSSGIENLEFRIEQKQFRIENLELSGGHSQFSILNSQLPQLLVFPNPTDGTLFVDLGQWQGQQVQVQVLNAQGQLVLSQAVFAENEVVALDEIGQLAEGLYYLSAQSVNGERAAARFVVGR